MTSEGSADAVAVRVPNTLRSGRLSSTINEVVIALRNGSLVEVSNEGEYAAEVSAVVEGAKRLLSREGLRIFQQNALAYEPVNTPSKESEPLLKPKIHHFSLKFTIQLSTQPIEAVPGATQQLTEPPKGLARLANH